MRIQRRQFLEITSLAAAISTLPKLAVAAVEPPSEYPRLEAVDDLAATQLSTSVPGLSVSVSRHGAPAHCAGYGIANVEHGVPVHADTMFQTGSVGKMFTATLILLLRRDGRLDIDAPLTAYFGDGVPAYHKVTARHLLTHTSGLTNYDEKVPVNRDFTDDELLQEFYNLGFDFEPGEKWDYCNTGFAILGLLATRVGGKHYGELLEERIFAPAGMPTARIIAPESDIVPNRSSGYNPLADGQLKNQWFASSTFLQTGDGAIYVSARDMMAWGLALRDHSVLNEDEYRLLSTPTTQSINAGEGNGGGYGMGMALTQAGQYSLHEHGGSWQGFVSHFMRVLEADLFVTVNVNSSNGRPRELARDIARLFVPDLP